MFAFQTLLASSLLASTALAHFRLQYPTARGFIADKEPQFCGGFPDVSTPRQEVPLTAAMWINSGHQLATVAAFISTNDAPKSEQDFNQTAATGYFQLPQGEACWNMDLGAAGFKNGSTGTLLIQYAGGDGMLYQCTDIVVNTDFVPPSNWTCTNDAAKSFEATHTGALDASALETVHPSATGSGSHGSASSAAASASASGKPSAAEPVKAVSYGAAAVAALAWSVL